MERNIKLELEYDGTAYAGFAPQPGRATIHSALVAALKETLDEVPTVTVAGRTDAGVHARGQVVSFRTCSRIPVERLPLALNSRLPTDIAVRTASEVAAGFHARFSAQGKSYSYTIWNDALPAPLLSRHTLFIPQPLALEAMKETAQMLVGRHDFRAFRSAGGAAKTSVRHLRRLELLVSVPRDVPPPGGAQPAGRHSEFARSRGRLICFLAEADGFLYNMVRILAGTLVEVGLGRRTLADVQAALTTGNRQCAGKTLPGHGLCLEWVTYPDLQA